MIRCDVRTVLYISKCKWKQLPNLLRLAAKILTMRPRLVSLPSRGCDWTFLVWPQPRERVHASNFDFATVESLLWAFFKQEKYKKHSLPTFFQISVLEFERKNNYLKMICFILAYRNEGPVCSTMWFWDCLIRGGCYLPKFTILASMFVCRFVCLSVRFVKHNSWTLWHIITKLGPHMEWVSSSSM